MKYIIKKMSAGLFLILLLFTSCSDNPIAIKDEIKDTAEQAIDALVNEDSEELFRFFARDIQNNHKSETMAEIQEAFDFIDGKIISYDYDQGGEEEKKNYGELIYYDCRIWLTNVTTDTGKVYSIDFTYHYIWDEKPECEGITKILIYPKDDSENIVQIGISYS